jgi:hypothetical protein
LSLVPGYECEGNVVSLSSYVRTLQYNTRLDSQRAALLLTSSFGVGLLLPLIQMAIPKSTLLDRETIEWMGSVAAQLNSPLTLAALARMRRVADVGHTERARVDPVETMGVGCDPQLRGVFAKCWQGNMLNFPSQVLSTLPELEKAIGDLRAQSGKKRPGCVSEQLLPGLFDSPAPEHRYSLLQFLL